MDQARIQEHTRTMPSPAVARREPAVEIWLWILGVVAVVGLIVFLVDRRRGSTGTSKSDDQAGTIDRPPHTDQGPWAGGG